MTQPSGFLIGQTCTVKPDLPGMAWLHLSHPHTHTMSVTSAVLSCLLSDLCFLHPCICIVQNMADAKLTDWRVAGFL